MKPSEAQEIRLDYGLSQVELGRRLGYHQAQVSRWEDPEGEVPPRVRHILSCDQCFKHFVLEQALLLPAGANHG